MKKKMTFQTMGSLLLSFATLFVLGGVLTVVRYPPKVAWDVVPLACVGGALILLGVGLYHCRKWAAAGFSLILLYAAYWGIQGATHPIPGYSNWLRFVWAVLLLLPIGVIAKYWSSLVWRGSD